MNYTCISADEVKAKIDKANKTLNDCFDMLLDFRYCRNDFGNAILMFQPLLAECLFELMQFYQRLHKEKDELIARKSSYEKAVFADLMKTNTRYMMAVRTAIDIEKIWVMLTLGISLKIIAKNWKSTFSTNRPDSL